MPDVKQRITEFLAPKLRGAELAGGDDIFEVGHINSLFAVQLVRFIEREFALELQPDDMDFDNFRTIDAIVDLVERKQSGAMR